MKIYYVYLSFYYPDESGYYQSPYFSDRKLAENYLEKVKDSIKKDSWGCWTNGDSFLDPEPMIMEEEVYEIDVEFSASRDKNVVHT